MTEKDTASILERIVAAGRARRLPSSTNAYRIANGEGDGLPGMVIENFAGRWLIQTGQGYESNDFRSCFSRLSGDFGIKSLYWKALVQQGKSSPRHVAGEVLQSPFLVKENGLAFEIDFQAGYSQGLFLDQRHNRQKILESARNKTVLNTFSYTCAFGVASAAGGGKSFNLDLSRSSLAWGKRNYGHNGIDPDGHEFIYGDVFDWLRRFQKRSQKFDLIVLDPPTFSRDRKGKVFKVEENYIELLELSLACLDPGGSVLCCCNTQRLSPSQFEGMLRRGAGTGAKMERSKAPSDFAGGHSLKSVWVRG